MDEFTDIENDAVRDALALVNAMANDDNYGYRTIIENCGIGIIPALGSLVLALAHMSGINIQAFTALTRDNLNAPKDGTN